MKAVGSLALVLSLTQFGTTQQADPSALWRGFVAGNGPSWHAEWNPATGTPSAIYGPGLKVSGRLGSVAEARSQAEALLKKYPDLLGRGNSRFVESSAAQVRHLFYFIYQQRFGGLEVLDARADVRINERGVVAMFGSSAVPIPAGFNLLPVLTRAAAQAHADKEVLGEPGKKKVGLPAPRLVIWAQPHGKNLTRPVLAWEVQIDERPGNLVVGKAYIDASAARMLEFRNEVFSCASCGKTFVTGDEKFSSEAHAAESHTTETFTVEAKPGQPLAPLTGTVMAWTNTGLRPTDPLKKIPLANVWVTSAAGSTYTDAAGKFSIPYTGTAAVSVAATLRGRHTQRIRVASGTQLSASAVITPGIAGTIQFGTQTMGKLDYSQTTTYHFVDDVNVWVRSLVPTKISEMNTVSGMNPRVNIAKSCNAYYTNFTINFYNESSTCDMTAFQTVVTHEWGHGLDHAFYGIIRTDGLSEGWADVVAILRSKQPIVGEGFFKARTPNYVRSALNTRTYPVPSTSVHAKGEVWMGWTWDVRTDLVARLGSTLGQQHIEKIVIPTIVANAGTLKAQVREVFILDDDDGNLNNGTPNYVSLEKASLKRKIEYPVKVNPNAGSYVLYGSGCPGSGKKVGIGCLTMNATGSPASYGTRANLIYAIRATAPRDLDVVGFELYTYGSRVVPTMLYDADTSGRPKTVLASSTMSVGATRQWYRTTFTTQVKIQSGKQFFVAFRNSSATIGASIRSGIQTPYFRNDGLGGSWNGPLSGYSWAYKVNCPGGLGALPVLANSGVPELNTSFKVDLSFAKPSANALLVLGVSDSIWNGIGLPLNLAGVGAPNCLLLSSAEAMIGLKTNTLGAASHTFSVPNIPAYFGVNFFNQYVIEDAANTFGLVFSNAGKGKIGKP